MAGPHAEKSVTRAIVAMLALAPAAAHAQGRQITQGAHAMASTPALPPAEAQRRFQVPPGFEVRLFAAEPQVVNPVAMTWDERGRLWVVELFEYPKKAPPGTKARDRIKILEDTNNDGRADKVTVFADGLNLATAIARYRGGVLVGQAPELLYLEDTNGDDVADRRTALLTGFGLQDTHELLNSFTWGPDGWLYMTHGVFTHSKVKAAEGDDEVAMDAALARFHPGRKKFEVFADGTSNPWGVDFDRAGNAFVSACVIDHLFHLAPGGVYERQAGTPGDPYAYDLLPSIVEHKHYRAAYAGVQIYQGDQYPAAYRDMIVFGNIHANSLNRDKLVPKGSSFVGQEQPDFLRSNDPWFRPVSELGGPDGNLWIADWYDRYPCYQNAKADPEGVDRAYGRIWRVVYTGGKAGAPRGSVRAGHRDLARLDSGALVALLADGNAWHRRTAQRLLAERKDAASRAGILAALRTGKSLDTRLAALWTLHGGDLLDEAILDEAAGDREPALRTWAARLSGERDAADADGTRAPAALARLQKLSVDADATVRAGVAAALRRMAGRETQQVILSLAEQPNTDSDQLLGFLVWRAAEPRLARDPAPFLAWLRDKGSAALPFSAQLARRALRRVQDTGDLKKVEQAVAFLGQIGRHDARLVTAALDGMLEGQRGQAVRPSPAAAKVIRPLLARPEPELAAAARQLGALWGDPAAGRAVLAVVQGQAPDRQRVAAIEIAAGIPGAQARRALLVAFADRGSPVVAAAAVRALGRSGVPETPRVVARAWKTLPLEVRTAALDVLTSRPAWAEALLAAVEKKQIPAADVPVAVRNTLVRQGDRQRDRVAAVFGRTRESSAELQRLIAEKKAVMLGGPVDFADGHEQAKKACLLCHKLHGEGAEVGPDLTGSGRATLDALLTNVIDPNQVIGKGYEQVTVTTKDGRSVSGRLVEDTPQRVTILGLNLRETIARSQVASVHVSDVSVMPEGLENLPDAQLRNLLWYIYQPPQDRTSRLRVELGDKRLVLLHRASETKPWTPLLEYVMDPALRPYIHPLRDPSGQQVLTDDKPSDHVWQHGVFTGLHGVNGLDFWTERQGKQRFVRLTDLQQETDRVLWKSTTEWAGPDGKVLIKEDQAITVHAPTGPDGYVIDFDWVLNARGQALTFGKYDYGGLSVRMPLHPQHTHLNAEGVKHKETNKQRSPWVTVERPFADGSIWGIAVLDHPGNERHPAAWRVDTQGLISPSNSIQGEWSLGEWRAKKFSYRLFVYKGPASAEKIGRVFESFAAVPFAAVRHATP